jgi:hypothetical protein
MIHTVPRVGRDTLAAMVLSCLLAILALVAAIEPATSATRATVTVSPAEVSPGDTVTTAGRGFPSRAKGSITFGGKAVVTFTASRKGTFSRQWQVPEGAESGTVLAKTPTRKASTNLKVVIPGACSDGTDNDGDSQTDYPADSGCRSASDASEEGSADVTQNACPPVPPAPPTVPASSGTPAPVDGELWSDPATWEGGSVPADGSIPEIPSNKTVVLDRDVSLKGLKVYGTLVFADEDLELRSEWIMVHGKLQIGTEESPFTDQANIVLTDTVPGENIMQMGDKGIIVMGGALELHGERRVGWTRLTSTAEAGSSTLHFETEPGWRVGDKVAIASTDFDPGQDEEREIASVSGKTVTLTQPLKYTHYGQTQTVAGCPVEERAEVALLTRNVTIEGEETSSEGGFGGQIMGMDDMGEKATMRVEGVEMTRMGQKNVLRRYPIHFHMLGDGGANSYLKDTSIHHTFNRCATIHGTNNMNVQRNVCYDHLGHGIFFEDGAEHDNVVENNLGFGTKAIDKDENRLLQSDGSAATFWITNPDNIVRNNVAAGSQGMGFWLAFPQHPTGLFALLYPEQTQNIWPRRTPLGEFSGNVAHSTGGDGVHVDSGPVPDKAGEEIGQTDSAYYDPHQDPTNTNSEEVIATFTGVTAYKNRGEGVWLRGANHRLIDSVLADNAIGATFASHQSFLQDSLVVGETANKGTPEGWQVDRGEVGLDGRSLPRFWEPDFPVRGYEFYDGRVGTENTTFANFQSNDQRRASALGVLLDDAFHLDPDNFATGLSFRNAERVFLRGPNPQADGDLEAVFTDTDGSVTGEAGAVVTANNKFLTTNGCTRDATWNAYVCPPGTEYVTLGVEAQSGGPTRIKPLEIRREDGVEQTLHGCCEESTDAYTNILPDRRYDVAFNSGTPSRAKFILWKGAGHHLHLVVPYPVTPKVSKYGCDLETGASWCRGKKTSFGALEESTRSAYYYDAEGKKLHLKIVDPEYGWEELEVEPQP